MKLILPTILLIVFTIMLNKIIFYKTAKDIVNFKTIEQNIHVINDISISAKENYDLKFLNKILDNNRIILVGESTHSDGKTIEAKGRLIKYLHENLNYDIILYEAGEYDCWLMDNEMSKNPHSKNIGGLGLFDFWWNNNASQKLFSYYLETKILQERPIKIGGFDIQFSGSSFKFELRKKKFLEFLEKNGIFITDYKALNRNIDNIKSLTTQWYTEKHFSQIEKKNLLEDLEKLEEECLKLDKSEENIIFARYISDIRNSIIKNWNFEPGSYKSMHFRDSLMAKNAIYQIENFYKDKKIIIWCSNIHLFFKEYNKEYTPMGKYLKDKYGQNMYSLAFTSYARSDKNNNIYDRPSKLAIENFFHDTHHPFLFLDFKSCSSGSIINRKFTSRINQNIDQKKCWKNYVDGVFFIDINKNP